ncbi:DUF4136 domain-containing protein [Catalinimonas sp. 4WD22]|uniref:DUF4136 domain-containing protein n=1 Tax=Catalinimonas locisalis TaxID=3133978 RepID=UPI003101A0A0
MRLTNKTFIFFLLAVLSIQVAFGQIKSDYDKDTDFSQYNTYVFAGWEQNSDQILNDFDKKRILDAMKSELDARGMERVESNGDATITLFVVINNKANTTAYTTYNNGLGYAGPYGWGWGMGPGMSTSTTSYSENDYQEGTFVVDMYDTEEKKLIWQGIITSVVKENPEKREKSIPKKIKKLMKKFPIAPVN